MQNFYLGLGFVLSRDLYISFYYGEPATEYTSEMAAAYARKRRNGLAKTLIPLVGFWYRKRRKQTLMSIYKKSN